jgi:hypothetical protein
LSHEPIPVVGERERRLGEVGEGKRGREEGGKQREAGKSEAGAEKEREEAGQGEAEAEKERGEAGKSEAEAEKRGEGDRGGKEMNRNRKGKV